MNTNCKECKANNPSTDGIEITCSPVCPHYRYKRPSVDERPVYQPEENVHMPERVKLSTYIIKRPTLHYTYCYMLKGKLTHECFTGTADQMERRWWALQTRVLGYDYDRFTPKPIKKIYMKKPCILCAYEAWFYCTYGGKTTLIEGDITHRTCKNFLTVEAFEEIPWTYDTVWKELTANSSLRLNETWIYYDCEEGYNVSGMDYKIKRFGNNATEAVKYFCTLNNITMEVK